MKMTGVDDDSNPLQPIKRNAISVMLSLSGAVGYCHLHMNIPLYNSLWNIPANEQTDVVMFSKTV